MSDKELRELDVWIAVNVYGWSWFERPNEERGKFITRKALFPPSTDNACEDGWYRANFYPSFTPAKSDTPRFSDWDMACGFRVRGQTISVGLPRFTTNPADAMAVLKKCYDVLTICSCKTPNGFKFWLPDGFSKAVEAETLELAICEFAKALFSKEGK